jgi:hypothetical protein
MKSTPEIPPAFPGVLPDSIRAGFHASSVPSTPGKQLKLRHGAHNHAEELRFYANILGCLLLCNSFK